MKEISCKLLVIGAGPGGYACAIRAGQLGIDTVVVEAQKPGGTCLNVGCIPSKALIHAADEYHRVERLAAETSPLGITAGEAQIDLARCVAWKDGIVARLTSGIGGLFKAANVKVVEGWARFRDGKTVEVETELGPQLIRTEQVVIATGSAPVALPGLPFDGRLISSTEALELRDVPRNLVVIGAGYIGLELGTAFAKLGAQVTVVEAKPQILPSYDTELARPVAKRLRELGVRVLTGAEVIGGETEGIRVRAGGRAPTLVHGDKVLVAIGRRPATKGWGLEELDLDMDRPFIRVDNKCRTSMRGVYAVGDVTGEPMLAHRAVAQGEMVAEIVAGHNRAWDNVCVPAICFTDPELVAVGLSPDEATAAGHQALVSHVPLQANGRALSMDRPDGFIRVVARADNHLLLGVQAVGHGAAELSSSFSLALEMGARLEDVLGTIHAHPTISEAFHESAAKALGRAIHV